MAKRKRLTPLGPISDPSAGDPPAPEVKSFARAAPIAQVAGEAASLSALRDLSDMIQTARSEGRLIQPLPLAQIDAGHLVRDRILSPQDEDMQALIASLRARGQQMPIDVVALDGGGFGLISGLRRLTALTRLYTETGAERFATVQARIIAPETASDAYVAMIEENEIRAPLSLYERARIVAKAVEAGVYPDARDALLTLYANAARARRSKIKSLLGVVAALDDVLRFPTQLSERQGLELAKALDGDPAVAAHLRQVLSAAQADSAEVEQTALSNGLRSAPGRVATPAIAPTSSASSASPASSVPTSDETSKTPVPAPEPTPEQTLKPMPEQTPEPMPEGASPPTPRPTSFFDRPPSQITGSNANSGNANFAKPLPVVPKPQGAVEPIPGVYIQSQSNGLRQTHVTICGPNVTPEMGEKITAWLRTQET